MMHLYIYYSFILYYCSLPDFNFVVKGTCLPCNIENCQPPRDCLAGFVKDICNCCYRCGKKEGERCDYAHLNQNGFGKCGDNLECRQRTDLDLNDTTEATCFCIRNDPLCGSDGKTYENLCHLTEERYKRRDGLRAVSWEPCKSVPQIISQPINASNVIGGRIVLVCEVVGFPKPEIIWQFLDVAKSIIFLPGNDSSIYIRMEDGPERMEKTSWLLFGNLRQEHEGLYKCLARNSQGESQIFMTVDIVT